MEGLRDDGRVMPLLPVTSQEEMWGEMGHIGCGNHDPPSHLCPTGTLCHARVGSVWLEVPNLVMMKSYHLVVINPCSSETHVVLLINLFVWTPVQRSVAVIATSGSKIFGILGCRT